MFQIRVFHLFAFVGCLYDEIKEMDSRKFRNLMKFIKNFIVFFFIMINVTLIKHILTWNGMLKDNNLSTMGQFWFDIEDSN